MGNTFSSWRSGYGVQTLDGAVLSTPGEFDSGSYEGDVDSTAQAVAMTDSCVVATSVYGHTDQPYLITYPHLQPVCAGFVNPDTPGAKAFYYLPGHTPEPMSTRYTDTVPSNALLRPRMYMTLQGNMLATVSEFDYVYMGAPDTATRILRIGADYSVAVDSLDTVGIRALGRSLDGRICAAIQHTDPDTELEWIQVTPLFSYADGFNSTGEAFGYPIQPSVLSVTFQDDTNPWVAGMAALCMAHGSNLSKVVAGRFLTKTNSGFGNMVATSTAMMTSISTSAATMHAPLGMFTSVQNGPADSKQMLRWVVTFTPGSPISDGSDPGTFNISGVDAAYVPSGDHVSASNFFADNRDWVAPIAPPFWNRYVRTVETP